jgi:AcrR family transcriptional regulator
MAASRAPTSSRRLSRGARHDQLVAAAIPLVARHGPVNLSLDRVAERAGVTRNLLYHYFPGGRDDLLAAVVDEAERQLLGAGGSTSSDTALSRILDHALAPTHAWRIHRMVGGLPGLGESLDAPVRAIVQALSEFRDGEEIPHAELVLPGYVAFAEAVLDGARVARVPRSDVRGLLAQTLRAVVAAG